MGGVPELLDEARKQLPPELADQLAGWPAVVQEYAEHPGRESLPATGSRGSRCRRTPTTASW